MAKANLNAELHSAISAVCPIDGVSVGNSDDKSSWKITFSAAATPAQQAAAQSVLNGFALKNMIDMDDLIGRFQDAEYALLMQRRATAITAGNVALVKQWDTAMANGEVNLNSQAAQSFKAALVTANILTQARADVIFS